MSSQLPADVQAALDQGEKINAIRLLRQHTGLDLKSAKAAVETGRLNGPSPSPNGQHPQQLSRQVSRALDAGHLLQAIKLLWQDKDRSARKPPTNRFSATKSAEPRNVYRPGGLGPGEIPHRPLSPGLITFSIALTAVFAWLLLSSE